MTQADIENRLLAELFVSLTSETIAQRAALRWISHTVDQLLESPHEMAPIVREVLAQVKQSAVDASKVKGFH